MKLNKRKEGEATVYTVDGNENAGEVVVTRGVRITFKLMLLADCSDEEILESVTCRCSPSEVEFFRQAAQEEIEDIRLEVAGLAELIEKEQNR